MSPIDTILELRKKRHAIGNWFMINDGDLPTNQCYLEYSNRIELVQLGKGSWFLLKTLSKSEAETIRNKYGLR